MPPRTLAGESRVHRRPESTVLAAALCLALVAACSGAPATTTPRQGGTLYVALDSDPVALNPLVANDPNSQRAYTPLFPLLYSANSDLSVGPDLAAGLPVTSASGTVLTVPLRANAKWSDGTPITADDVVFTVATEMDPSLPSHAAFDWSRLKSVAKAGALSVTFTLKAPDDAFLANALVTPIVPQHAFAHVPAAQIAQAPFSAAPTITGGPYTFDHRTPGKAIFLNANPNYFLGAPHADHVVETVVSDAGHAVDQLENGTLSWAPLLPPSAAASAASAPGLTVSAYPSTALVAMVFNLRPGHVFADQAVRQALAFSIAHDALVGEATASAQGYPVWGDINPNSWAFDQGAAVKYAPDSGRSRQLLSRDGWSVSGGGTASRDGQPLTAQLIYASGDATRSAAAAQIAQQAHVNGFALTVKGLDDTAFAGALRGGAFDAALVLFPAGLDPDSSALFATGGPENYGAYSDPMLDSLLGAEKGVGAASGQNLEQLRKPTFSRIEQILSTDLPCYFLWVPRAFTGFSATVGGVAGAGPQLDLDRADSFYRDWYLT